jgi:hypothetical protein
MSPRIVYKATTSPMKKLVPARDGRSIDRAWQARAKLGACNSGRSVPSQLRLPETAALKISWPLAASILNAPMV